MLVAHDSRNNGQAPEVVLPSQAARMADFDRSSDIQLGLKNGAAKKLLTLPEFKAYDTAKLISEARRMTKNRINIPLDGNTRAFAIALLVPYTTARNEKFVEPDTDYATRPGKRG